MKKLLLALMACFSATGHAGMIFTHSPTSAGALDNSIPDFGGLVVDMIGLNGNRVTQFVDSDQLYSGVIAPNREASYSATIGAFSWFDSNLAAALGGGFSELAMRFSVWDGDTALGDPDFGKNYLYVNEQYFGNFSDVDTVEMTRNGETYLGDVNGKGFAGDYDSTGWFYSANESLLNSIYNFAMIDGKFVLEYKSDSGKRNFVSFSDEYIRPVEESVSEPGLLFLSGLFAVALVRRRIGR